MAGTRQPVVLDDPQAIFRGAYAPTVLSKAVKTTSRKDIPIYGDGKGHMVMEGPLLTHVHRSLNKDQRTKLGINEVEEDGQTYVEVDDLAVFACITYARDPEGKPNVTVDESKLAAKPVEKKK